MKGLLLFFIPSTLIPVHVVTVKWEYACFPEAITDNVGLHTLQIYRHHHHVEVVHCDCINAMGEPQTFYALMHLELEGTEAAYIEGLLHRCGVADKAWKK